MSAETNNRYSDKDLAEFKTLLQEKIKKAEHDLELIKSAYIIKRLIKSCHCNI